MNLAIGVFDGVHRGHRDLIGRMVAASVRGGLTSVCLTFDPDPDEVLHPERSPLALTSVSERLDLLKSIGVSRVDVLPFTREVASRSAHEFLSWARSEYGLKALWAGTDFALGQGRAGTIDALKDIGAALGFDVHSVQPLMEGGRPVSSTWVRELLREGDVQRAGQLLGRHYAIRGEVVRGARRGRELGFPTANLIPPSGRVLPSDGIYFVEVGLGGQSLAGVSSLGPRPTFGEDEPLLETYILDFQAELYGAVIEVRFVQRLRPVTRFESVEALRAEIERDVETAKKLAGKR
ncbi:MAG: bifunctional riboflavin kinase/FAD synthetase [Chloroflexi bacterium]|nr:bifunctional riboflavin kinase/FAD synthetase [Chloroflexota bacterium]